MRNPTLIAVWVVVIAALGGAAFLYNKRLNLESDRLELLRQDKLHERALKCADEGRKFAREYMAEESSAVEHGRRFYWDDPEFHYNQTLGTCLVRTRSVDIGETTYQHARITDLSSNKAVIESYVSLTSDPNNPGGGLTESPFDVLLGEQQNLPRREFVSRAKKLMSD